MYFGNFFFYTSILWLAACNLKIDTNQSSNKSSQVLQTQNVTKIESEQLMKIVTGYGDGFIDNRMAAIFSETGELSFSKFMGKFNGGVYLLNGTEVTLDPSFIYKLSQDAKNTEPYVREIMRPAQKAFQRLTKILIVSESKDKGYKNYLLIRQNNIDKTLAAWRKSLSKQITKLLAQKNSSNWNQQAIAISYADAIQSYLVKLYSTPNYSTMTSSQDSEIIAITKDIDEGAVEVYAPMNGANNTEKNNLNLVARTEGDLGSIPYYFSFPESAMLQDPELLTNLASFKGEINYEKKQTRDFTEADANSEFVGQRRLNVKNYAKGEGDLFAELATKKIVQEGDILLTYRAEWADSLPYAHITMGISHAGVVWRGKDGKLYNADQPLDGDYSFDTTANKGFASAVAKHYQEITGYHIIRPRPEAIKNINQFNLNMQALMNKAQTALKNGASLFAFNSDYFTPRFKAVKKWDYEHAYNLSNELNTAMQSGAATDRNNSNTLMFCSEFAWAMLNLARCQGKPCSEATGQIFDPIPFMARTSNEPLGMIDGPLMILNKVSNVPKRQELTSMIFKAQDKASMSAGHRAVNQALEASGAIKIINAYYTLSSSGKEKTALDNTPIEIGTGTQKLGELLDQQVLQIGRNYSPTSFLLNTLQPKEKRQFDYVATVYFGN